jgi:alpha-aminoadipate/glutamate carrier protein LysW
LRLRNGRISYRNQGGLSRETARLFYLHVLREAYEVITLSYAIRTIYYKEKRMNTLTCIECDGDVTLDDSPIIGEILECPDCGVELEVTGLDPVEIDLAPEVEEDWGE